MEKIFIEYPDRKFCSDFVKKNIHKQEEILKIYKIFDEAHSIDGKTIDYLVFKRRRCNEQ